MRQLMLLVLIVAGIASAQSVNITGTVTSGGQPLQGVVVRLVASQIADTTTASGTFTLTGIGVSTKTPVSSVAGVNSIEFSNNVFTFTTSAAANLTANLYDMRGAVIGRIFNGRINQGKTDVAFSLQNHASEMYVMKITSNGASAAYKFLPQSKGSSTIYKSVSSSDRFLGKTAAFDWLQATKSGYTSHLEQVASYSGVVNITMNQAAAAAPDFGSSVMVFDPTMSMSTIQSTLSGISSNQDGAQFGHNRYAWLFKPGSYSLDIDVGFYTEALGLGLSPDSVQITGAVRSSAAWMGHNATCTFWKAAAGFCVTPTGGNDIWEASQAAPVRRMHIKGGMALSDGGWSSGGYVADCKVDGAVNPGSQQQYFSRNNNVGSWGGGGWNYTFVGTVGGPTSSTQVSRTVVTKTPVIAEKPFLVIDKNNNYSVLVPTLRRDSTAGVSWTNGTTPGVQYPIDLFYIAKPTDNAASINAALTLGKNILFTPGHYNLEASINVTRPGTIVLGIGFPTLAPTSGNIAMKVSDVDGVRIGGFLFEGTTTNSPCLLEVGDSGSTIDHSKNPIVLSDIFTRVGGEYNGLATTFVKINSNDAIFDGSWLWRADHGTGAGWTSNKNLYGLIVNGNNVTCYGMEVEHTQAFQTWWNGNNGRLFFYQSEMPYDPPNNTVWSEGNGILGFPSYKVSNTVTSHEAWGLGVYSVFNVTSTNAYEVPTTGTKMHHMCTQKLGGGEITHVINGVGGVASSSVLEYP